MCVSVVQSVRLWYGGWLRGSNTAVLSVEQHSELLLSGEVDHQGELLVSNDSLVAFAENSNPNSCSPFLGSRVVMEGSIVVPMLAFVHCGGSPSIGEPACALFLPDSYGFLMRQCLVLLLL